ncbi:DUF6531 domain-containing protein [Achromobacter sp.]|uniref:DUF6531 domain-containing protein n=1 Tax=Achromobacter sp. TaxID=134375 RepID=UPI0028ABDA04|nr:DUF6531 domain-containing protein [Achromobacter sp.]
MTAMAGLPGALLALPGQLVEEEGVLRLPDWWRRRESGVFLRKLPAAALAGLGPGGVHILTGQLLCNLSRRRDVVPTGPLELGLDRIYDSRITEAGCLGPGWRTRWDVTLQARGESMVYHDEWGRTFTLPRPEPGSQVIVASASLSLACLEDGQYVIADIEAACLRFRPPDNDGVSRPGALELLDGRRYSISRDERGAMQSVSDEQGRGLFFGLDEAGRVRTVARGRQSEACVTYRYGDDGRLCGAGRVRGKPLGRYAYQDGLLADIADATGEWSIRWVTAQAERRIAGLRGPDGRMWLLRREPEARVVRMQASDGAELHWCFDPQGRILTYRNANGAVYKAQYDDGSRLARVEAPDGPFEFEYDGFGRVTRETAPWGHARRVSYAFGTSVPMMLSREGGRNWFWRRDERLRPLQRRAPSGTITVYEHDTASGMRLTKRDDGIETRYDHDAAGRLRVREDAHGALSRYLWTDSGDLHALALPGHPLEVCERDDAGNLRVRIGEGASARLAVHGPGGDLLSLANAVGHVRHWRYDSQGALALHTDEEGATTRFTNVAGGHDVTVQGPGGGTQRWVLDARRRVWARRDADGVMAECRFDASGRVTHLLEAAGPGRAETVFGYGAFGRLVSRQRDGLLWTFEHDDHGRLVEVHSVANELESSLAFEYDAHGRVVGETSESGVLLRHIDSEGHVTAHQFPCGLTLFAARDAGQRAVQISYALDGETATVASIFYDDAGRETTRVAGALQREITRDDAAGVRLETSARVTGGYTRIDALDRHERRDAAGRLVEEVDVVGRRLYDYDRRGQLVRSIGEGGMVYTTWDPGGNIIALDSAGWAPPGSAPDHRPARVGSQTLVYDDWGRVLRRDGPLASAAFTWDAAGRLSTAQSNGMTVAYAYDAAGRLAERRHGTSSNVHTRRFVWDGLRLMQEWSPVQRVTYAYAPVRAGRQSYAPIARLIQRRAHAQAEWPAPQVQHLYVDAAGRVRAAMDGRGEIVWTCGTRPWGERIGSNPGDTPAPPGFAGHWVDPDIGICWNGRRFYDPLTARYLSPDRDAPPGVSPYRYVAAPASQANPTGLAVSAQGVGAPTGITMPELPPIQWVGACQPAAGMPKGMS